MHISKRIASVCAVALVGCANTNSIYRTLDLTGPGNGAEGVSLDIKQRAILSNVRMVDKEPRQTVVCAEPSPDALSAYVASLAATGVPLPPSVAGAAGGGGLNAAFSSGEAASSVGLRTQSIQLLRDLLFANCLTYMNGATNAEQYYALQRRSQNITLGLLAIEQLTGAVKADQAALSSSATSATGADNTDKEKDDLDKARNSLNEAQKSVAAAEKSAADAKSKLADQTKKVADARKALSLVKADDEDKRKTAQETLDAEVDKQTELESSAGDAQIELAFRRRAVANAGLSVAAAQEALVAAQRRVRASTTASAQLSAASAGGRASGKVAEAVEKIVDTVLKASSLAEDCSTLIASAAALAEGAELPRPAWFALQANCLTPTQKEAAASVLKLTGEHRSAFVGGAPPPPKK